MVADDRRRREGQAQPPAKGLLGSPGGFPRAPRPEAAGSYGPIRIPEAALRGHCDEPGGGEREPADEDEAETPA